MVYLNDFDEAITDFMADFSGPATVTVYQEGAYDPATGDVSTTKRDYKVKAILLDIEIRSSGYSTVSGTLIEAGDKRVFIQPPEKYSTQVMPVPRPNKDKFTMGGVTYKIVTSKQVNPATDGAILYELILRQ